MSDTSNVDPSTEPEEVRHPTEPGDAPVLEEETDTTTTASNVRKTDVPGQAPAGEPGEESSGPSGEAPVSDDVLEDTEGPSATEVRHPQES